MAEFLEHYLSLATKAIFIENILLAYFLCMCSFLALSNKVETASGIGKAVIFVNAITVPLNWLIKTYLLDPGALSWTGISAFSNSDFPVLSGYPPRPSITKNIIFESVFLVIVFKYGKSIKLFPLS